MGLMVRNLLAFPLGVAWAALELVHEFLVAQKSGREITFYDSGGDPVKILVNDSDFDDTLDLIKGCIIGVHD